MRVPASSRGQLFVLHPMPPKSKENILTYGHIQLFYGCSDYALRLTVFSMIMFLHLNHLDSGKSSQIYA